MPQEGATPSGIEQELSGIGAFLDEEIQGSFKGPKPQDQEAFFFVGHYGFFVGATVGIRHAKHVARAGAVSMYSLYTCDAGDRPSPLKVGERRVIGEQSEYSRGWSREEGFNRDGNIHVSNSAMERAAWQRLQSKTASKPGTGRF